MKRLLIIFVLILSTSCSVEQRIKDYSYINEWYYLDNVNFQVYKTKSGRKYIIVLNNKQTYLKRKYIK